MTLDSPLVYRSVTIQIKSSFGLSSLSLPNPLFLLVLSFHYLFYSLLNPYLIWALQVKEEKKINEFISSPDHLFSYPFFFPILIKRCEANKNKEEGEKRDKIETYESRSY